MGFVKPELLLERLEAIAVSLDQSGHALGLVGVGSVGLELSRLDAYSDLDFFAIVEAGYKARYIADLKWLEVAPVAFVFQNTVDGFKLLYQDGVFCEFAVFELAELSQIPFAAGRIIWKRPEVSETIAIPAPSKPHSAKSQEWQLGEALTNLFIGLKRFYRGEKLSAQRFVQHFAVDRVLELAQTLEAPQAPFADPFSLERRFEARFPHAAGHLAQFVQGYERTPESALAILEYLEAHFPINPAIAKEIRTLVQQEGGVKSEPNQL